MVDYSNIRIPEDDFERHNERRKDMGLTWLEYVDGAAPRMQIDEDRLREIVREEAREAIESVARA